MELRDPVKSIPLIGEKYRQLLTNLGIETITDLLRHYPSRYEAFSPVKEITNLVAGEKVTIKAEVVEIENIFTRHGKKLTKAVVGDASGNLALVWFNQTYLTKNIHPGEVFRFSGELKSFSGQPAFLSPEYERVTATDRPTHTRQLVPIYPETAGVSSKWLRSRINWVLNHLSLAPLEILPKQVRNRFGLIKIEPALRAIHFPQSRKEVSSATKYLAFEEMFRWQLSGLKRQQDWKKSKVGYRLPSTGYRKELDRFVKSLPFGLTTAQTRSTEEILADLERETPMNRILQGDVGSGKTIVAVLAAYASALSGFQTVYMAPTEILAQQVFAVFTKYLSPFGINTALQTGTNEQLSTINYQLCPIIVGTHALLHRPQLFNKLALVIIDEQHRFGVQQRGQLLTNNNDQLTPHLLTMTATPIPRSLALTFYGHLDISIIDEMPPGIKPTKTWLVPEEKREAGYNWIREQLAAGLKNQAFIICPLIEESEHENFEDIKAVTTEFERLKKIFPKFKLGLLHGKIKSREKEKIIDDFRAGETQILVTTPVVEVGIDIPQANIIVIEGAQRFGLASLHQLRGRVGRAGQDSFCLLFSSKHTPSTQYRLRALTKHHSGLELAELDLKMRGPGELYGLKQHGVPELKMASLSDLKLIKNTRAAAEEVLNNPKKYPQLAEKIANSSIAPN